MTNRNWYDPASASARGQVITHCVTCNEAIHERDCIVSRPGIDGHMCISCGNKGKSAAKRPLMFYAHLTAGKAFRIATRKDIK